MKICYFIFTRSHGRGGHYYSLRTTAEAIQKKCECLIIDIGLAPSPIIKQSIIKSHHIYFNGFNIITVMGKVFRLLKQEKPDVLHAFDEHSYTIARFAGTHFRKAIMLTKCGGSNPGRFYPYAKNIIVYSTENKLFFNTKEKFLNSNVSYIPNRVSETKQDYERIARLRSKFGIDKETPTILRIARFSPLHRLPFLQSIYLTRKLNEEGQKCNLLIIGVVEDGHILEEITKCSDDNIKIVTDDKFTLNASELIDIADFVVGTGRGLMEAAARSKILLAPLHNSKCPVLVSNNNFDSLLSHNFSIRSRIEYFNEHDNFSKISELISDSEMRKKYCSQAMYWYVNRFCIDTVIEHYCKLYSTASFKCRSRPFDFLINVARCLRSAARYRSLQYRE